MRRYLAAGGTWVVTGRQEARTRWTRTSLLILLAGLMLAGSVSTLHAQGPALTTISEVRYSDTGWGTSNAGNLIGRFAAGSFTLPRYVRGQDYFLRSYDNSSPAKYSRYSTALHVDFPLDYTYET